MSIMQAGKDVLRVERTIIINPVSTFSEDITDFEYKKAIELGVDYYLNDEPISREQAEEWILQNA